MIAENRQGLPQPSADEIFVDPSKVYAPNGAVKPEFAQEESERSTPTYYWKGMEFGYRSPDGTETPMYHATKLQKMGLVREGYYPDITEITTAGNNGIPETVQVKPIVREGVTIFVPTGTNGR